MPTPTGATNYITLTSNPASVAASMPDAGGTFAADLVIDEAAGTNWEGGAATFVSGLAADYSDLRVTDSTGAIIVPFGVKQFSQTAGSRKLILGLGIPSTAPLLSSSGVEYRLWRGCTGGQAENKAGVVPTADGWAGYWPLEEASGTFYDWTANANNAARSGCSATSAVIGSGQAFDGISNYAQAPDTPSLSITGSMSAFCWVKRATAPAALEQLISKYDIAGGQRAYKVELQNNGFILVTLSSQVATFSGIQKYSATSVCNGSWTHVGFVFNATAKTLNIYVNGALSNGVIHTGYVPASIADSIRGLALGADYNNSAVPNAAFLAAEMDEPTVSSVARSANWIATYYAATSNNAAFWTVGAEQSLVYIPRRRVVLGRCGPSLRGVI